MYRRIILNSCLLSSLGLLGLSASSVGKEFERDQSIQISWLGHAMFLIEGSDGTRIITDPYNEKTGYKPPRFSADIVTISHYHYDHGNIAVVDGLPRVIDNIGKFNIGSIILEGIRSHHDEVKGEKRGGNTIYKIMLDGLVMAHMGDYGQSITDEHSNFLRNVDVLLIPVGGVYTINFEQAAEIVQKVKPGIVIPMHYKTDDCVIAVNSVEPFLQKMRIVKTKGSSIQLSASLVPKETEVWVMDYIQ